jgi:glycosyltransferase involved in cell wall biosynthesis
MAGELMTSLPPLVSCIMPTRNRRAFVGQAIWYFLRQDYPSKELIIVDDGEDAVADLIPGDERIRYSHCGGRRSLGSKRNLACETSRGGLIAHWDDDDWIGPHRLSSQVSQLLAADADACGTRSLLHYHLDAGQAWNYDPTPADPPWLAGGTLLYRRSVWDAHRFADISVGEDRVFISRLQPGKLQALADSSWYIALLHPRNTAPKNLADGRWERRPLGEVEQLLAGDRGFYVALRNGRVPCRPSLSPSTGQAVSVCAPFMVYDGYGSMAEYLVLGMVRAGATVRVIPLAYDQSGLTAELKAIVRRSTPDPAAPVIFFSWPSTELERFAGLGDLFINTMWESSRLPAGWTGPLNRARALIVPTHFVADVCRDSGVDVPIEVIPEGIDPEVYHYMERPERAGLTTMIVGTVIGRKHTREGIAAWKQAFDGDPEARLIIKARFNYRNYTPDDPRISFVDRSEPGRGISHWYQSADVLLALGNEGFGLPLAEGMATGLPVIALNSEGQSDICREAADLLLPVTPERWEPYEEAPYGRCGKRGVPDVGAVASRLRWVSSHRAEARAMGRAASGWILRHRNIWHKGPAVLDFMEQQVRPARPLRRLATLWAPSLGSACGVAEYTAHLAGALGSVRATGCPPDLRGVRVLHVQHEVGIFDDTELTRHLQDARRRRVPVAVTEHSVGSAAHAWERDADVLISLTERGTAQLRRRWPGHRVEHIPHGCPSWFPPRKTGTGRTIGAFGFLEPHKGFWQVLDVLKALPGSDLLLFSHAKSPDLERRWAEAARGLAVRHIAKFLPSEEVARQLAAEADILVFWYQDTPAASASGAVRVGLATGVPVLASPTNWFSDLTDVTYQPESLIDGARRLLDDKPLRERLSAAARTYCDRNSWPQIAERHRALWQALEST